VGEHTVGGLSTLSGELFIVDVMTWPELPPTERDELTALLDSMTFEPAGP
jgi:hypothetical protein